MGELFPDSAFPRLFLIMQSCKLVAFSFFLVLDVGLALWLLSIPASTLNIYPPWGFLALLGTSGAVWFFYNFSIILPNSCNFYSGILLIFSTIMSIWDLSRIYSVYYLGIFATLGIYGIILPSTWEGSNLDLVPFLLKGFKGSWMTY